MGNLATTSGRKSDAGTHFELELKRKLESMTKTKKKGKGERTEKKEKAKGGRVGEAGRGRK